MTKASTNRTAFTVRGFLAGIGQVTLVIALIAGSLFVAGKWIVAAGPVQSPQESYASEPDPTKRAYQKTWAEKLAAIDGRKGRESEYETLLGTVAKKYGKSEKVVGATVMDEAAHRSTRCIDVLYLLEAAR